MVPVSSPSLALRPLRLPPNQLRRGYPGGEAIRRLRGGDGQGPEDWIGSTTTVFGESSLGLSRLEDGRLLHDLISAEPEAFLGPEHVARFGADPGLLVKLLDAGGRLPVHCHPDRSFARRHLGSRWGKTEAWIVLETSGQRPVVWVGCRQQINREVMRDWVEQQDSQAMLHALNEVPVQPGDVIGVPAGVPHAIGPGILICELQEPSDFGFLYEWKGYAPDPEAASLGLGWQRALEALDLSVSRPEQFLGLLPELAEFFAAEWVKPGSKPSAAGFAILLVTAGSGELVFEAGRLPLRRGEAWLVPYAAGETELRGEDLRALRCLPPQLQD